LGTYLVRKQGLSALSQLKNNVETLENPIAPLAHGIMILLAGALLLTPGFFTDAVGFSLLVPNIRIWLFERVKQRILHSQNGFSFTHARTGGAKHSSKNGERQASGTTIEGVYEELASKNDP
ncbi:FxsA family protein, partial [Paracoccaceae bacterium]|nr:FxsA family protein [Paracoccaceae bacterium]